MGKRSESEAGGRGRATAVAKTSKGGGSKGAVTRATVAPPDAASYDHPTATTPLRPDVGTQAQFKKKKPPTKYRYDSSLSPALDVDGQNSSRELGEWLLAMVEDASRL